MFNCCVLSREATNTNLIVFGLTQSGLEPTIYCTRGEHAHQGSNPRSTALEASTQTITPQIRYIFYLLWVNKYIKTKKIGKMIYFTQ